MGLLLATLSYANSNYTGKYLCNDSQAMQIEPKVLNIANVTFKYQESTKKDGLTTDIFIKGVEKALVTSKPNKPGHYALIIHNVNHENELPFLGDCTKAK